MEEKDYSHSSQTKQFCLEKMRCRIHFPFDNSYSLYYSAYIGVCYHFVISGDNRNDSKIGMISDVFIISHFLSFVTTYFYFLL